MSEEFDIHSWNKAYDSSSLGLSPETDSGTAPSVLIDFLNSPLGEGMSLISPKTLIDSIGIIRRNTMELVSAEMGDETTFLLESDSHIKGINLSEGWEQYKDFRTLIYQYVAKGDFHSVELISEAFPQSSQILLEISADFQYITVNADVINSRSDTTIGTLKSVQRGRHEDLFLGIID